MKAQPELTLATVHRHSAPKDAAGFRIRLELEGRSWIGPRPGQKYHNNATSKMLAGDYYKFTEQPRVPKTTIYRIDYVDRQGLIIPGSHSPKVHLESTGGSFQERLGPSMREKQRALEAGVPPPLPRKRIYEIARELGMLAPELLSEIAKLGFPFSSVQNTIEPDQVNLILRHYAERLFHRVQSSAPVLPIPSVQLPSTPQTGVASLPATAEPDLDESLPIPPLIQPEHTAAQAEVRSIVQAAKLTEREGLDSVQQLASLVEDMGTEVDRGAGLIPRRGQ